MARSNSTIENYGFLAAVTLFEKALQPFFGMSTQLVIVETTVQYFDKNSSSLVSTHAQMIFLKKRQSVALILKGHKLVYGHT